MRKCGWSWVAVGVAALTVGAGCKGRPPAVPPERAPAAPAASAPVPSPSEPATPWVVTPERLDLYLAYRDALLKGYLARADALQRLSAGSLDAGTPAALRDAKTVIDGQQELERRSREALGLSAEEIGRIQQLVSDVVTRRRLAEMIHYDAQIQQFQALQAQLPPEQRPSLADTLASLEKQRDASAKLTDLRARYGDANVDAVLAREQALFAAQDRWAQAFTRRERKASEER